jgi:nitrate/TMAO reductase-like tetraheme cytochrome c subunit
VAASEGFRQNWLRPALFFGNNPISLVGGAITTASAVTMFGYWLVELLGRSNDNPYLGIIFFLILPALFVLGLLLIPVGVFLRRAKLKKAGQIPEIFPEIDLHDKVFRHGLDFVLVATAINVLIVAFASYRGVEYMDTANFCGQACHVMHPEYAAYQVSAHSHVSCVECHIGSGVGSFVRAKINGTKQLFEVMTNHYPAPIGAPVASLRPASEICESCHNPAKFHGDKLVVKTSYADDEQNTKTQTVLLVHLGGRDAATNLSGIHGAHMGHIEYIASDSTRATIPWVQKRNADGSTTDYAASTAGKGVPSGERRTMDCIDCHNRATHSLKTPEEALNQAMTAGAVSLQLPWVHKKGLELLKANYSSEAEARAKIPQQLEAFYRSTHPEVMATKAALVKVAGQGLVEIYTHNVFPEMKVTWGTHPNHLGHTSDPGCFRCHDGDHNSKDGKSITQDCTLCHNIVAQDEANPKALTELGIQ